MDIEDTAVHIRQRSGHQLSASCLYTQQPLHIAAHLIVVHFPYFSVP